MKHFLAVLLLIAVCGTDVKAGSLYDSSLTTLRAAAILTSSDVYSTATAPAASCDYVDLYCDFTIGSLDYVYIVPCGAASTADTLGPASTGYFQSLETSKTLSASGRYLYRVPKEEFGGKEFIGVFCKGVGTATNSSLTISRRDERE